jgi:hypothetical protein
MTSSVRFILVGITGLFLGMVIMGCWLMHSISIQISEDTAHVVWMGQDFHYDFEYVNDNPKGGK